MRFTVRKDAAYVMGLSMVLTGILGMPKVAPAADENASPSVTIMINSADELLADAKYLLSLTTTKEQEQWPIIQDYVKIFLIGIDRTLPTRIQVLFGGKAERFLSSFPVTDPKKFLKDNLDGLGIESKSLTADLHRLGRGRKEDTFNGFLLHTAPYAHIAQEQADLNGVTDPREHLKPLLDRKFDVAGEAVNAKVDAAAQAKRRELFQNTRKEVIAALKKIKGENDADFEFRKAFFEVQMDEAEWFFAESQHILAGMTIDQAKGVGRVDIELTPIADSALAKTVGTLCAKPSYFANVEKSADAILFARLNHPLDAMRKKNFVALAALGRQRVKAGVDADAALNAEEKTATKQLVDKTFDLMEAAITEGHADAFVDVHQTATGKNTLLAGFRTADGTKAAEIVNLVPKARAGRTAQLEVAEESGVKIHTIALAADKHPRFHDVVGAETLYVGTSKDAVWCAAGEGALDALKAAIKKTREPAAAGAEKAPWVELVMKVRPFVEQAVKHPPQTLKKVDDRYNKLALEALQAGDDALSIRMTRQEGKIVGEVSLQTGLLRFAGKAIADFSRENLDDRADKPAKNAKKE